MAVQQVETPVRTSRAPAHRGDAALATPWWAATINLAIVALLGAVAILAHADPRLVAGVAVMVCAALGWSGPWPTITFGRGDRD